jgi:two-component system cell cycle sensor histidine kinase/response regulator CckA
MSGRRFERIAASFGNLSLSAKGILVVSIPVCALLAAIAVFYDFERQTSNAQTWVEHTITVRSGIRRMRGQITALEDSIRGYLLTQRDSYLEPYWAARKELPGDLALVRNEVADNPAQLQRLAKTEEMAGAAMTLLESVRQDAAANGFGRGAAGMESAQASIEAVRRQLGLMEAEEERLLQERTTAEHEAQHRLDLAIFAGGLVGLLGGFAAALLFTRSIVRRVHRVEELARRVAGQSCAEPDAGRGDEVTRLERTLNQTARLLAAQSEQLQVARNDLESRVARRTVELSQANEYLRQANDVRQALIKSSPLAIFAIDLEGKVIFWSPAAERIFGWTEAEAIGQMLPVIPEHRMHEFEAALVRLRAGESMQGDERTHQKKDGSRLEVAIWTAPLRDAAGAISGFITIDADITERKLLEEQFRQSQKLEAVGRLAGGVAHDFNNLLTVIMGYVEMLITDAQGSPVLIEYAQEIQFAADRASSLTSQLLAFSRRQISQPKVLDLNESVAQSMKLLQRVIGEDIVVLTHPEPDLGRVKADPIHIDQALMNLVVNARDAMPNGGTLTIETANVFLDDSYAERHIGVKPGRYCMLAVSDTGTGMTPEVKSRIFEPFFTTKESGKGTGLGLSIVYGVVKQSGGDIMVYSEAGKGSTFKLYFPMAEAPAAMAETNGRVEELRGSETVLLCEDEERIRKLVYAMLAKQGYKVLEAETPDAAMRMAREYAGRIDLLLTDIVMPQMSGFELAKTVFEMRPEIKVLYMSGYTDNRVNAGWVLEANMPFLHKPFTAAGLTQKVREALGTEATEASRL